MRDRHGDARLSVIFHPDRVESFRVSPVQSKKIDDTINGYPLLAKGPSLSATQQRQVQHAITRMESFAPWSSNWCGGIQPGVAIRFHRGAQQFTVLLCFKCEEWQFVDGNQSLNELERSNLDGAQREMARLVKQLFPNDPEIQAIELSNRVGKAYRFEPNVLKWVDEEGLPKVARSSGDFLEYLALHVGRYEDWTSYGGNVHITFEEDGVIHVYSTDECHAQITALRGVRLIP